MDKKPNFILVMPDQWRGDCLGFLKHDVVETPYLDHIANEGVAFVNAYSSAPTCIPARACLATGLNSSHHGRLGYEDCINWKYEHTMMNLLRNGGYQTLQVGKTHFYPQRTALGFEEMRLYDIPIHQSDFDSDYHMWLKKETNDRVRDTAREVEPNSWVVNPWKNEEYLHPTHWTTDSAIELLSRRDSQRPFFMQIGYHRPHAPYDPPKDYYDYFKDHKVEKIPYGDWAEEYDYKTSNLNAWAGRLEEKQLYDMRRAYYANIKHVDYEIGRLYNWLKKKHLLKDTYIIFTSDHGELLGDHNLMRKSKPFEGSAKVPFVMRPPTGITYDKKYNETPISHFDIMPTLLNLADIPLKEQVDGLDINDFIKGENMDARKYIHGEHSCENHGWQYITNGKEKYIWETKSGREYYFDLINDPKELHNGITDDKYQSRIKYYRNELIDILKERTMDHLVVNGQLNPGEVLPNVRDELRNNK